jgi:hypothetical protein
MRYLLVEDRTFVHLCIDWNQRFFQSELNNMGVDFGVPPVGGYIKINDNLEFIPLTEDEIPSYDPLYEYLAGPVYTYLADQAKETYTKFEDKIENIRPKLKAIVAAERYRRECLGVVVNVQDIDITVETDRETRNIFVQKYMLMGENDVSAWKFPEGWLNINKAELGYIIFNGATYIQNQFNWEQEMSDQIDAATTIAELKTLMVGVV